MLKTQKAKNLFFLAIVILFIIGIIVVLVFIPWQERSPDASRTVRESIKTMMVPVPGSNPPLAPSAAPTEKTPVHPFKTPESKRF